MKLYILRHTTASDVAASDADRELTNEGQREARVAGDALAELGVKPKHIFSSPLVRARQTANLVAKALDFSGEAEVLDELKNGTPTGSLLKALKTYESANEVLLVGHIPSLSDHLAALIGAESAEGLPLGKGSVACVELQQLKAGAGQLRWLMRQKQLQGIAK